MHMEVGMKSAVLRAALDRIERILDKAGTYHIDCACWGREGEIQAVLHDVKATDLPQFELVAKTSGLWLTIKVEGGRSCCVRLWPTETPGTQHGPLVSAVLEKAWRDLAEIQGDG
jgi:hypothetical protein